MPPPALVTKKGPEADKKEKATESPVSPTEVTQPVEKPKMEYFDKFPMEIQQMIWSEAMHKPACHTFKIVQRKAEPEIILDLAVIPSCRDPSSWRYWKSLLYCRRYKQPTAVPEEKKQRKRKASEAGVAKPKAEKPKLKGIDLEKFNIEKKNLEPPSESKDEEDPPKSDVQKSHEAFSKLANISFQTAFPLSMVQLEPIRADVAGKTKHAAAMIDVATDLVILEFNRGQNARPNSWFEHTGMGNLDIHGIRDRTRQLKRVAVHYKKAHANSDKRGPFQCWCLNPRTLKCDRYKACPMEQACFLDCFANLEEFYHVIDLPGKTVRAWLNRYRDYARRRDFNIDTWISRDKKGPKLKLAHFYDHKFEYLQLPPVNQLKFISELWIWQLPFENHYLARECLATVIKIYKSKTGKDDFNNTLEQRKKVKFGILATFEREEKIEVEIKVEEDED